MLTIKICSPGNRESIHEAEYVNWAGASYTLALGNSGVIELPPESVAYVCNENGVTISRYERGAVGTPEG